MKTSALIAFMLPSWTALAFLISKARWYWMHDPDLRFGWLVVILSGYLFCELWRTKPPSILRWSWRESASAAAGCFVLFVTQIYQAAYGLTPTSLSGLFSGAILIASANLNYIFGRHGWRHFAFALGFLFFAVPVPPAVYRPIVLMLQSWVTSINVDVLNLIGLAAEQSGNIIHLPNATVGVDDACSGIRSFHAALMATCFIGYLTLRIWSLRVFLVLLGAALAFLGNIVRSLFLSYNASVHGVTAIDKLHDTAGWSILLFTAGGVAALAVLFARVERALSQHEPAIKGRAEIRGGH